MASAERTETFDVEISKVYNVLKDYESYSDFMDGVSSSEILSRDGNNTKVKYHLNIIKKFTYSINLTEVENESISWSFDEGDLFKSNDGHWMLKDNGDGTTEVTYKIDAEFKVKVPGMISKKLISSNLPSLMKSVCKRAKSL